LRLLRLFAANALTMVEKQNVNISFLIAIGFISAVLLFVIVVGIEAWFHSEVEDERTMKHQGSVNWQLADHELTQQEKLHTYRKVDQEKQTVTIPIESAIKLLAHQYEK